MLNCLAVSTEYRRVTDGQTDRQTDILRQHSPLGVGKHYIGAVGHEAGY